MPRSSPALLGPAPDKPLLTAWLLLLLRGGAEIHGWGLVKALRERGVVIEPGRAYRFLRELEGDGALSSRWTTSASGPRRRSYAITRAGHERLAAGAATITATWELHDAFLHVYEQEPAAVDAELAQGDDRAEAQPHVSRELLAAWMLLLIERHASYGYDLRRVLHHHRLDPDPATLYRTLHKLERMAWIESRWMEPLHGPSRRLYRITNKGRRNLDDVARVITSIRDMHAPFLHAYTATTGRATGTEG